MGSKQSSQGGGPEHVRELRRAKSAWKQCEKVAGSSKRSLGRTRSTVNIPPPILAFHVPKNPRGDVDYKSNMKVTVYINARPAGRTRTLRTSNLLPAVEFVRPCLRGARVRRRILAGPTLITQFGV